MRINSKGQVTIPIAIRNKARLRPHAKVEFDFDGEYVRIRRARRKMRRSEAARLIEHMRGRGGERADDDRRDHGAHAR